MDNLKELSTFTIGFDFDFNNFREVPKFFVNLFKLIESSFDSTAEKISKGTTALVPDVSNALPAASLGVNALRGLSLKELGIQGLIFGGGFGLEELLDRFGPDLIDLLFKGPLSELERLKILETEVITFRRQASDALSDIENFGERPNAIDENGLPLDKEFLLARISALNSALTDISEVEENLTTLKLQAGPGSPKPEPIEINPVLPIPVLIPTITIDQPPVDQVLPIQEKVNQIIEEGNKIRNERSQIIQDVDNATASLANTESTVATANQQNVESIKQNNAELQNQDEIVELTTEDLLSLEGKLAMVGDVLVAGTGIQRNYNEEAKQAGAILDGLGKEALGADKDTKKLAKQVDDAKDQIGDFNDEASDVDLKNTFDGVPDEIIKPESVEQIKSVGPELNKAAEEGKKGLSSLGVFAGNIATNIAESFSDFISTAIKGDFDGIEDLWDNLLDSLQDSIADFLGGLLADPIRVAFEATLTGGEGGIGDFFKGLFDFGKDEGKSTAEDIVPDSGTDIPEVPEVDTGILSTIGNVVGTIGQVVGIVGTIASLVLSIGNIVKGLFAKKPQLDVDLDKIRDEFGRSTGEAAKVLDFLDDETANSIINISTKRKAGVGDGDGIQKQIREAIQTQIADIQDIINTLPSELASALNESLLNTSVDIESEVKGDRLLEFDETKNISQKFEQFINGDLQARFLFSIREFFVGAFESLGVLGSAAQDFIDAEFEKFQGLSREERIEAGEELLQDFQTLTDAFNVLNNNGADSIGATVNSIKNLSNSLEFDGVPSIEELDAGLEELINAAELDPDVIQDYLDLRNAILEAQRAILGSIQSIISSISSLNSIIVDGGGSAFDLTGFINDGLDSVTGLLGQDGLSVEDREELLGLGTGFLDQLIAEEQAAFQQQLEAAQAAAEAAAEAQRSAIRAQISGLEDERDLIEENFDARLEALEEEFRLAGEFARLTESIQQTLNSIILGPDSVFTAVERLNIVQGDIASLQSELAATTDPSRQLELAGQLEDSLSTLFDLAGEAFGVNSPEFVAIFDQVTGGLNDLLDLTGNRERSVEEINAEIEALNVERNQQLEAIDAQIESLNDQLSSIQAENVEATFQASDRVQELAEFFRNEYITLLEERFAQLGEVSETGFATELDALTSIDLNFSELKDSALQSVEIEDSMLVVLRSIDSTLSGAPSFRNGTGGFVDFGSGTLAFLHGREAVIPESQFQPFSQFQEAAGEMNVNINVNVDGGSSGTVETLATNIEDMLVRSIRQGGKLRSAVQEAGARRLN